MSDDHSNVDKKSGKKGSGSGSDFKPPHKKSKDFQGHYESKGNEKGPKDQSSVSKGNPPHQDDQHGSHGSNKPKSYTKNRKESANHPGGAAKRKHPKVSKDIILDFYAKAPVAQEVDELITSCAQLFVKEKQIPVNQEDNQLDPNEGLVPKNAYAPTTASGSTTSTTATSLTSLSGTTASTTTSSNAPTTSNVPANQNVSTTAAPTTTTTEPKPTTQAPVATPSTTTTTTAAPANTSGSLDPIQAMREKMKRDKAAKEQQKLAAAAQGEDANKRKESEQLELEKKKAEAAQKEQEERKLQSAPPQESAQDKEEGNGEKYSDIDEMYEKRLKNKEGEEAKNVGTGEESNRALDEDNQRPEWENVDAGQVVREIGKDEFVSGLSQDKKTIFGDKYVEKDRLGNTASGVDFSKVSFDIETKNRMNDNFGIPSDMYGGRGGVQQGMPQEYYNPQDAGQSNMYKGAQGQSMQQQQGGSLYANKSYNANQAAPVTPTSSAKQTAQAAYPSVIFKYFSPNYDAKVWSYIDLEDHLQGPFSGRTMDEWYSKGYLPLELSVTIGKNSGFRGLKELAEIIINHNTQESVQQPEKPIQKIPSSTALPEQQYQQQQYQQQQQYYQQQQQQQQYQPQTQHQQQQQQYYQQQHHQQQQQQYQPQQQYSQQQQQQQYYRQQQQQQNPQANEMQRFHSDTSSYGTNFQTTANRVKNFEGSEVSNMYYGQQQQQQGGQGQFGGQHDYHRSASATNIQNQGQNYYQNYDNYYQEPQQQKQQQGYQAYTKAGSNTNLPSSSYYQEGNMYQGGYNQPGYNQPQKTATQQWKGPQQGAGAGYSGGMTPTGGGYGGQNASFGGQAGYSGMYGGMQGGQGQGQGQGNMTYAMQQQMLNRGSGNPNMGGDMKGMQGMLGMQRPASRQQQQEEPDY